VPLSCEAKQPPSARHDQSCKWLLGGVCGVLTLLNTGCLFVMPVPVALEPTAQEVLVDATPTDRTVVNLLPREIALNYLQANAPTSDCTFGATGVTLADTRTYEFAQFRAKESQTPIDTAEHTVLLFLETGPRSARLACAWQRLDAARAEKLLTAFASLGVNYREAGAIAPASL